MPQSAVLAIPPALQPEKAKFAPATLTVNGPVGPYSPPESVGEVQTMLELPTVSFEAGADIENCGARVAPLLVHEDADAVEAPPAMDASIITAHRTIFLDMSSLLRD
jgi:hypothetical protein